MQHKISNKKLYKITKSEPISKTITERRWKLFGHILRLAAKCPARKAMQISRKKQNDHRNNHQQRYQTSKRKIHELPSKIANFTSQPSKH